MHARDEAERLSEQTYPDETSSSHPFRSLVGANGTLRDVVERAQRFAASDAPILLHGETGVGKALLARAIHESGSRRDGPFMSVNCAGIGAERLARELFGAVDAADAHGAEVGKLERAKGGTLYLCCLDQLPHELQPVLQRVLETQEVYPVGASSPRAVDFRLICGAEGDLQTQLRDGGLRRDLYYRIAHSSLHVPPLRERMDDLPALVEAFCAEAARSQGTAPKRFDGEVLALLGRYDWPGNVRELRNVVESMLVLCEGDVVQASLAPQELTRPESALDNLDNLADMDGLEAVERRAIEQCLRALGGNLTRTARKLRIARSTLYAKLKKYGLEHHLDTLRVGAVEHVKRRESERPTVDA
jgi:sigma-54 dependent transcriptional regulator, acetoin dehydrogenase operon transcriptional activator AcoR